jgi:hypothetical protein
MVDVFEGTLGVSERDRFSEGRGVHDKGVWSRTMFRPDLCTSVESRLIRTAGG